MIYGLLSQSCQMRKTINISSLHSKLLTERCYKDLRHSVPFLMVSFLPNIFFSFWPKPWTIVRGFD